VLCTLLSIVVGKAEHATLQSLAVVVPPEQELVVELLSELFDEDFSSLPSSLLASLPPAPPPPPPFPPSPPPPLPPPPSPGGPLIGIDLQLPEVQGRLKTGKPGNWKATEGTGGRFQIPIPPMTGMTVELSVIHVLPVRLSICEVEICGADVIVELERCVSELMLVMDDESVTSVVESPLPGSELLTSRAVEAVMNSDSALDEFVLDITEDNVEMVLVELALVKCEPALFESEVGSRKPSDGVEGDAVVLWAGVDIAKLSQDDSWDEDLAAVGSDEAELVPLGLLALLSRDVCGGDDDWAEDDVVTVVLPWGESVATVDEPDMAFVELLLNLGFWLPELDLDGRE
jgi:hypothetical protein